MGPPIIGVSENIRKIRELVEHVAHTGFNTVIFGESGVGKEVIAQNLYMKSPRMGKPFVKINCAALPEGLLESELFGYERGAFTGAEQKRKGKFQLAHGGVLLLDEIGDMSLVLQAKLLHVLQTGEFAPLGSEKDIKTDTWVIAATNHDLKQEIMEGKFREDLYYRLNIIKIVIAPLRERPEDIPPLIDYYLQEFALQLGSINVQKLDPHVVDRLMRYHWPGNVRELQNVLKRMLVLGDADKIVDELFEAPENLQQTAPPVPSPESNGADPAPPVRGRNPISELLEMDNKDLIANGAFSLKEAKKKAVDKVEREIITYVLAKTDWNRSKAAKILKVSYKTLLNKITELSINPPSGNGGYPLD
ncbi:sigma-54 interaction domain-containing protein [Desulfatitalea alkaliphila]|uniref:Sigma-54 dependent transcriptional regulator n=1 Tax=Desulfatitalea alkaliphila TaxID=2929485 RepID=A0AA41R394_9BACT|nr:sigma-54 dependent transcriptional regulator [Desulfatitalea alkaliphila]MCJ8502129.1 sigma-54 dependent transcriptional regulator [Desulfatitalea alkaliphila]